MSNGIVHKLRCSSDMFLSQIVIAEQIISLKFYCNKQPILTLLTEEDLETAQLNFHLKSSSPSYILDLVKFLSFDAINI